MTGSRDKERAAKLGPDAQRQMSEMYRWYSRNIKGSGKDDRDDGRSRGRHVRIARTTTSTEHPTYPPFPANTFVVEFGTTEFVETPGLRELTFEVYDPEEKRVAHDINCQYHEEGELVYIVLVHDQWYILGGIETLIASAELNQDLCDETTGIEVVNPELLPHCTPVTIATVDNPRKHRGPNGAKVLLVRRQCRTGSGDELSRCSEDAVIWEIVDIEKEKLCVVTGVESRDSCLVAWALPIAAEWCPPDEPDDACVIVEYIDCEEELPPCDDSLTFDPLYACCWL